MVKATESWLGEIDAAFGHKAPTFTEWQQARIGLDKQINFAARNASPEMEALKQIRSMMERELEVSGEAAAKNVGSAFAEDYQATKSLYQSVRQARDLTERGVSRELVNNSLGLRATMGALSGFASGSPIMGTLGGVAGKIIQDRGDVMAADLLSRAASVIGIRQIAARTEASLERNASKLVGARPFGAAEAGLAPPTRMSVAALGVALQRPRERFEAMRDVLATSQANPAATAERLSQSVQDLAEHHPRVASAVVSKTIKGLTFLHSKLPPSRRDPFSLTPHLDKKLRVSDAEVFKFNLYADAVHNPMMVLTEANNGTLVPEHVEAVREVYPALYSEIQEHVKASLANATRELPYAKQNQLGVLLGIPGGPDERSGLHRVSTGHVRTDGTGRSAASAS